MKLLSIIQIRSRRTLFSAFTLVETMMAMFVFVIFVVAGMIAVQIFGLRMNNFTTDKLLAAGGSSKAMDQICNQIRGAQFVWVGNFTNNIFTPAANGTSQQGTALQVFPTTNTTPYTIYYLNPAVANLYSITNGQTATSANPGTLLASWITNSPCFWSENFQGNINTTTNPFGAGENCTIRMVWNFRQYAAPNANLTDEFYAFQTRATPRAPNLQPQ
jgi:hypothetical protein